MFLRQSLAETTMFTKNCQAQHQPLFTDTNMQTFCYEI